MENISFLISQVIKEKRRRIILDTLGERGGEGAKGILDSNFLLESRPQGIIFMLIRNFTSRKLKHEDEIIRLILNRSENPEQ